MRRSTDSLLKVTALIVGWFIESPLAEAEFEFRGSFGVETRIFFNSGLDPRQDKFSTAAILMPELTWYWDDPTVDLIFKPFARIDSEDKERTLFDIRELLLVYTKDEWVFRAGIGKVFWGAVESVHLIDIINQTDLAASIDAEEKLGQPMIHTTLYRDWGDFHLFLLPGFRERTFPGPEGRLRTQPWIDTDQAIYESGRGQATLDLALRWFRQVGPADVGVSYFHGISREPSFRPGINGTELVLIPYYEIIDQGSIDVQAATGGWLWKFEGLVRSGQGSQTFAQAAGGFEYTFYGILNSMADLGLIGEFIYDSRGNNPLNPFANEVVVGARVPLNDFSSTEILVAGIIDWTDGSTVFSLEASRRLDERWVMSLECRLFSRISQNDFPLNGFRRDDYVELKLEYFF